MARVEIEKLTKEFGFVRVLHSVDLTIEDGEFVVLLGPSGCGKSTILRTIAGLEDISGGILRIDGRVMNNVPAGNRGVAMVFQNYALYPHMSAYDNLAFGLRRQKLARDEIDRRVRHVAGLLDVAPLLDRRPGQLSGGQQQRVAMGRAMIKTPKVFLFDEPFSNLDAALRDQLRIELKKLHHMLETTTIFVTHDQLEAMTLADKVVVLRDGRIEQAGSPREIYHSPANLYVARFIGSPAMNLLHMRVAEDTGGRHLVAEGLSLPLDAPYRNLGAGADVTLGVRPRDLRFAGATPSGARLIATVGLTEFLGGETLMQLRIGPHELAMLVKDADGKLPGSQIEIAIPPESIYLFDRATQRTLTK